jgi:ATP-dependent DNA helicase 2 subunit 2
VTVLRDFCAPDLALLRVLADEVPSGGAAVDILDAVIVAMDLFVKHGDAKANKRIFLVTDAGSPCDAAGLDQVVAKFNEMDCKLNVIGVDFAAADADAEQLLDADDDAGVPAVTVTRPDAAATTDGRSATKRANEQLLRSVCSRVAGAVWPVHSALEILAQMRSRAVLQRSSCRPILELASDVKFPVHLYVKTTEQKFPSLQKVSLVALEAAAGDEGAPPTAARVKLQRTYYSVADPDTPVSDEHQIKAYKYGKNLVPFSAVHEQQMKYAAPKCLQLLGTFPAERVPRWYHMRSVEMVVPAPGDKYAPQALAAFAHALSETAHVAVCRYVRMNNKEPKLVALAPEIVDGELVLLLTVLPFVESVREYQFPCIDAYGAHTPARFKPSDEQHAAMRALIEGLDLMTAATDDDGARCEAFVPELVYNPVLQYFYQCVQHRALHPSEPLPAPSAEIIEQVKPPASLDAAREVACARVAAAFPLERVEAKQAKKRDAWQAGLATTDVQLDSYLHADKRPQSAATTSGAGAGAASSGSSSLFAPVTLDSMARANGVESINTVTPVADFEAMLRRRDVDLVSKAVHEMCAYIEQAVEQSLGSQYYSKALECVQALRRGCKGPSIEESETFNHWLRHVRAKWENGAKNDFWQLLVSCNITLLHEEEADDTTVTKAEALAFLSGPAPPLSSPVAKVAPPPADKDELEDLLAEAD